jgi:hypothetical protein
MFFRSLDSHTGVAYTIQMNHIIDEEQVWGLTQTSVSTGIA